MRTHRLALTLASFGLVACHSHHDGGAGSGNGGIPVFREQERNDDPLTANHFGVLRPGQRFFIDGFVRDDLADPFDGFAFTAGAPLHVDFELFIGNAFADLDVSLYDPQIDQTVASWASTDNPEVGGVDVFAGGLDFHLVIESFSGDATYSLAITVLPLFLREPPPAGGFPDVHAARIAAVGARNEHAAEAGADYKKRARAPSLHLERVFELDLENGLVIERRRLLGF